LPTRSTIRKYLEWNFEVQQAIGSKMSLNVNYVGTHGYDTLIQNANLNAPNISGLIGTFSPFWAVAGWNQKGPVLTAASAVVRPNESQLERV